MVNRKTFFHYKSGYRRHERHLNDIYNSCIAILLLILSLPLFLLISLIIIIREGPPVFYKGTRLGKNKEPFRMYKFRTLVKDAEDRLQGDLLGNRTDLITPTGKFLRDTRLDELPQLLNVLRRDMDIIGPRPVRPEVYEKICCNIVCYDRRFKVRPGIIGLSQVFTPHSTPKEIRSMIDNSLIRKQERFFWNFSILIITAFLMCRALILQSARTLYRKIILEKILRRYQEKRKQERIRTEHTATAYLINDDTNDEHCLGHIIDINHEAFLLHTTEILPEDFFGTVKLKISVYRILRNGKKTKKAVCECRLYRTIKTDDDSRKYVLMYQPLSPFNSYIIDQYFLYDSVG